MAFFNFSVSLCDNSHVDEFARLACKSLLKKKKKKNSTCVPVTSPTLYSPPLPTGGAVTVATVAAASATATSINH